MLGEYNDYHCIEKFHSDSYTHLWIHRTCADVGEKKNFSLVIYTVTVLR
jgi:hypothetical protein